MVGDSGKAYRPQKDGIVSPQNVQPVLRHHSAVFKVILASPVVMVGFKAKAAVQPGDFIQDL